MGGTALNRRWKRVEYSAFVWINMGGEKMSFGKIGRGLEMEEMKRL